MGLSGDVMNPIDKLSWLKDLARAEQSLEETGNVDLSFGLDPAQILANETESYLQTIKSSVIEVASVFNQMKGSAVGRVKVYGISNTVADFMLFRNGFKLIFAQKEPGVVSVRHHYVGTPYASVESEFADPGAGATPSPAEEDLLIARWGAFGLLEWTFHDHPIRVDYLVRYYFTKFVRESVR